MNISTNTLFIWNPSSGSSQKYEEIREQIESDEKLTAYKTRNREDAIEQVEEACRSGVEKLIVAGGDGTVSSAIQGVMESDGLRPNLKILPLGTGNDFARSLGINPDPEIACREWKASQCRAVDVVRFTNSEETRWYANMLTGGNTGLYMDHMTEEIKQRWGPFCYLRGVIDVLKNLEVFQMTVEMEGQRTFSCKALNVFLANGGNSGGGLTVSPHAQVDDGLIDLVLVREGEPEKIAELTSDYLFSDFLEHELIEYHQASSLRLTSDPPLPLTADGELVGETPVELKVFPKAISVLLPSHKTA